MKNILPTPSLLSFARRFLQIANNSSGSGETIDLEDRIPKMPDTFPPPTASVDITPIDTVGKPMAHLFKSKVD